MSSSSSIPKGNDGLPELPPQKKVKGNNFYCFVNNGAGPQLVVPLPTNSFAFTSSLAVRPVTANMLRPGAATGSLGSGLQRRISLLPMLAQNQHLTERGGQPLQPFQQPQLNLQQEQVPSEEEPTDVGISFKNFPYYLSGRTKHHLIASCFLHMTQKVEPNRSKIQRPRHRVLLSGPEGSEIYQETLALALSQHFGFKLLVLDCHMNISELCAPSSAEVLRFYLHPALLKSLRSTKRLSGSMDMPSFSNATSQSVSHPALPPLYEKSQNRNFKIGDRVIFIGLKHGSASRGPSFGNHGTIVSVSTPKNSKGLGVRFDVPIAGGVNFSCTLEASCGFFCDANELCIDTAYQIKPDFEPFKGSYEESRLILFMKEAQNCLSENYGAYQGIHSIVNKLPGNVFVIGSHIEKEHAQKSSCGNKEKEKFQYISKMLLTIFPDKISIEMPNDRKLFDEMKHQLIRDAEFFKIRENMARFHHALVQNGLEAENIETLHVTDRKLTDENAENVVKWALGYDITAHPYNYSTSELVLSQESIFYGLDNLRAVQTGLMNFGALQKDMVIDNEFEKRVLDDVILHNEIGVKFDDIGSLDKIKDALKEMVMLPLQMPELFRKGQLRKPCRGILLFGPPGTGKTMLAKAVATECGANFLSFPTSSIASKWYGESEKIVKAIFSVASKIAPSVVFIDEADSLFGRRREQEHEVTRRIKNEFMLHWDGLRTKDSERVLVLAATNRPFDLDEAIIRRMPLRFMVNLPDVANRSNILKVILSKEELSPDVNCDVIAEMTDDFSGSDLKNLCVAAAYCPLREMLKRKDKGKSQGAAEEQLSDIRPLEMADFKHARDQVKASIPNDSFYMKQLLRWNEVNGEGGRPG